MISIRVLEQMQISYLEIEQDSKAFCGLIPGMCYIPMGHITLAIILEEEENFRRELCTFKVINLDMVHNAVIARPHLTHLVAIPNYTYMMLKLPGMGVLSR